MKFLILMLICLGSALATANEPATAALDFLEKVRSGTLDLSPGKDTALSPHTAPEKRKQITRRLERLAGDLGKGKLEAGEVTIDDNLAAVVIRNSGGFDPSRMRVFAIGLVKVKNLWLPAPLPASFENTGFTFPDTLRLRIASLENWMLRKQVLELDLLREQSGERMRQDIAKAIDPALLRSAPPEKIAENFLAACAKRDLPAILGFLGGLQPDLPDDWPDRLRSADSAVAAGKRVGWPWRLVMAKEVVRVPVDDGGENSEGLFSFACLDPAGTGLKPAMPKVEILHIDVTRGDNDMWKVNLPPTFLLAPDDEQDEAEDDFDQELLDSFPREVRKLNPPTPAATIAEAAAALQAAFVADSLLPFFSLMDLEGDEGAASRGCARAAQSWWLIKNPEAPRLALPLGFHEHEKSGIVSFQFFSPREPDRLDVRSFFFEKNKDGWLLMQGLRPTNSPTPSQIAVKNWSDDRTKTWRLDWRDTLLSGAAKLDAVPAGNAPPIDAAKQLVEDWLTAMRNSDIQAALKLTVTLNQQGGAAATLQNLGYELGTAMRDAGKASIVFTERGETWTTIGVKSQASGPATYPLYLAINTPAGPRLLISTGLFATGRELLNNATLGKVKDFAAPPVAEELRTLFTNFQKSL